MTPTANPHTPKKHKHDWYPDDSGNWICDECGKVKRMSVEDAEKMWDRSDRGA